MGVLEGPSGAAGEGERLGGRVALLFASTLFLAAALRIHAWPQSFWFDEVASARFMQEPLAHLWSDWMRRETNPPLYYTMLRIWSASFGGSDVALRMLSLLYEAVSIGLAFLIGRRVAGDGAGLAAAALLAVSPAQIHYSLEVRAYAQAQMAALAAIQGLLVYAAGAGRRRRFGGLALYVGGCVVACYSHTMLALLPALCGTWGLCWLVTMRRASSGAVAEWIAAHLLILLLCGWWWRLTIWQIGHASANFDWIPAPGLIDAARFVLKIYGPDRADRLGGVAAYLILALAILPMVVFAVWMIRKTHASPAFALAVCAIGSPLVLFVLSMVVPVMLPRTLFWSSGLMLVCFGIGFATMPQRRAAGVLLAVLLSANLLGSLAQARDEPEPFAEISRTLNARFAGASVVTSERTVAFGIARYCPADGCSFDLRARVAPETFAADMPMPQVKDEDMIDLACSGRLITVIRAPQPSPGPVLGAFALPVDLTRQFTGGEVIAVTRWRPRTAAGRADAPCDRRAAG